MTLCVDIMTTSTVVFDGWNATLNSLIEVLINKDNMNIANNFKCS